MVVPKKSPVPEGNFDVRRGDGSSSSSSSVPESRPNLPAGELGGFIFICNNDTMDLERCLFEGLPQRYQELVRAIQPGMPLFLYNYSTRKLYGVYEAASNGGLNIEPDAWAESKDSVRNGKPVSKYPSQVRVKLREKRPPLDEDQFRPFLRHYEYPKFKLDLSPEEVTLELTTEEAEGLVRLFLMENQDESGWQKVRPSKPNRSHHVPTNPPTGRRRLAPVANGAGANGSPALTGLGNPANDGATRPASRADASPRWRTDSDSWSGSSSAGTVSSSWTSNEEDRPKKSCIANGALADAMGSGFGEEKAPEGRLKRMEHVNGSSETETEAEVGTSSGDATYSNGVQDNAVSNFAARGSSSRPGFASYSAAVMARTSRLPISVQTSGCEPPAGSSINNDAVVSASRTDSGKATSSLLADTIPFENLADKKAKSTGNGAIRSPKADSQSVWVAQSRQKADSAPIKGGGSEDLTSGQQTGASSADEKESCLEVERKPDRAQPWSKTVASAKSAGNDSGNGNGSVGGAVDSQRPASQAYGGPSVMHRAHQSEDDREDVADVDEDQDMDNSHGKDINRKTAWQGNDAAVLRRIEDPDPAVCSSTMNGESGGLNGKTELESKYILIHGRDLENEHVSTAEITSQKQQGHLSEQPGPASSSHGSKIVSQLNPHSRFPADRRPLHEYPKHDRHLEERPGHYRKQQLPLDHAQNPPISHARQHGHNLPPIRMPTSPPPPLHASLHHPLPASTMSAAPIYRERPHNRGIRAGSGSGEGALVTYRPVTNRTGLDGDMGLPSPISPGPVSTVPPSPVPPSPVGPWPFSPQIVVSPSYGLPGYPTFYLPLPVPAYGFFANVDILHTEILDYARSATPTAEARRRAEAAVECVRKGVKQLWADADVEVFGSFATGLCLCHSDVDVVVVDTPPPSVYELEAGAQGGARALAPLVRDLAAALGPLDWCESIMTIERATMPVVKLRCMPDGKAGDSNTSVAIDITIGGKARSSVRGSDSLSGMTPLERSNHMKFEAARNYHNGLPTREYVIERLRQLPALAPLVLLLKSYLHKRGLNDVYSGGLGSFSLTLMLVFYLERAPPFCGMRQDLPPGRSFGSTSVSVDTHSASSCDEVDEVDDNISTSSYCSTNTSASSSSNESTAMSGESNSATSSLATEGRANSVLTGDILQGLPGGSLVRRAGGILEELLTSMQTVPAPTLGVLLLGFLRMFENTDFSSVQFVLKGNNGSHGGMFPVKDYGNGRHYHLWIDDPLRPGSNIGAGSFNMRAVQLAMGDMLKILTQPPIPSSNGSERAGIGPGRRRPLVLLDQLFAESGPSSS